MDWWQFYRINLLYFYRMEKVAPAILFYDGDCGLCNRVVRIVLRFEKNQKIQFTSLDSSFTKQFFLENGGEIPDKSTVLFYSNYHIYMQSEAALHVLSYLKFPFPILKVFRLIPICWRDRLYKWIAANRNRLFSAYCVLPTEDQKARFID